MRTEIAASDAGERRTWWRPRQDAIEARLALLGLLPSASIGLTVTTAALLLGSGVLPPVFVLAIGHAVSTVGPAVRSGAGSPEAHRLVVALVVVGALFVVQQSVIPLTDVVGDRLGFRVRGAVFRRTLAAALLPATVAHLEEPVLRDLVSRATAPGQYGPRSATRGLVNQWSTRLGGLGAIVLLAGWHWWAGLLLLAALVHSVRRMQGAHLELVKSQFRQTKTLRRSDYLRDLLLEPPAAKETRIFGLGPWLTDRFRSEWHATMVPVWAQRRGTSREAAKGLVPIVASVAVIASIAVHEAMTHALGLGHLVVVLQATVTAMTVAAVNVWDTWLELGLSSVVAMQRLEEAVSDHRLQLPGERSPDSMPAHEIRFEGVSFHYDESGPVFTDLDLVVPAGRSLAIVGENGSGKTTLVKLLTRMYDPTGGRITVDGVDLRELDAKSWQRRTAAVFQDFVRYPWTAAENVALSTEPDRTRLEWAAANSGATAIVADLDEGWDTLLAREFGGTDLSGGQWQRLALARALYAAEAGVPILILDEPTAHLDVRQEADFYDRFLELTAGRTTLVISHRFSTVRRADRIVVIDGGRVIESGTHAELLASDGRYAYMFRLQASRFAPAVRADEEATGA